MEKKTVIIDGNNFQDLGSFYDEMNRILTRDLNWKTGHNLDAFNDLLCGGFGVYDYEEHITIIWQNFSKSRTDLGDELCRKLIEIIKDHKHIDFLKYDFNGA